MKILYHLGHPAHFHLFKNVITFLNKKKLSARYFDKKERCVRRASEKF